jgi:rhamnosyltransferase
MAAGERAMAATRCGEVGVAVVTHRARRHLPHCLPPLLASPLRPRVLVVDSASDDGTVELAAAMGAETLVVPREQFNHGLTREMARRQLGTPVVVMLAADAYPLDDSFLERLVLPLREGRAAAAYGRQIPHPGADLLERLRRAFEYPAEAGRAVGSRSRACSNACAAWSSAALDAIGGFRATLVGEDQIAAAALVARGYTIAYVADAVVRHSCRRGPLDELRRGFDLGWTRSAFAPLFAPDRQTARGRAFAMLALRTALREEPAALPRILRALAARSAGYRLGLLGPWLPRALARRCRGEDYFWTSVPFRQGALAPAMGTA